MKKIPKIVLLILLSNMLFASNIEIFRVKIEKFFEKSKEPYMVISTYQNKNGSMEYQGSRRPSKPSSLPLWQTIQSFDDTEHNSSQRVLKERFEELIPYYLNAKNLFFTEETNIKVSESGMALKYHSFFKLLRLYTLHIKRFDEKNYYQLMDKMLYDFNALMKNSNNLVDYMISLSYMNELLGQLTHSKELTQLLKKYPLSNPEILFEKLELEKERTLSMWKETEMQGVNELGFSKEGFEKFKNEISTKFEKILNKAHQLELIAIKDGSTASSQQYRAYIAKVSDIEQHRTFLNSFKYHVSLYIIRGLKFLGIESDFRGRTTEVTLSLLCGLMSSHAEINQKSYQEHKALFEIYEQLKDGR